MDYNRQKDKILESSKKLFEHAYEAEQFQRAEMLDDLKFS